MERSELEKALADCNEAIRLAPHQVFHLGIRATLHRKRSDFEKALADHDEMIRLEPDEPAHYRTRAGFWREREELDRALEDLAEALRLRPRDMATLAQRAEVWAHAGDEAKSRADLDRALEINPKADAIRIQRGLLLQRQGAHDQAQADFDEAVKVGNPFSAALYYRGLFRLERGDVGGALADFDKDLERFVPTVPGYETPSFVRTLVARAEARVRKPDFEGAIQDCTEVLRLDPANERALQLRVYALMKQNRDHDRAIADLNELLERQGESSWVLTHRGISWRAKGEFHKALADYDRAIEIDPASVSAWRERGNVLFLLKQYREAIGAFDRAIALEPNSLTFLHRGITWDLLDEPVRALADFNQAIELDPSLARAYAFRASIWARCADATVRDGARAVESATRACELDGWKDPADLETLAAAHAEKGAFLLAAAVQYRSRAMQADPLRREHAWRLIQGYLRAEPVHRKPPRGEGFWSNWRSTLLGVDTGP